MSEPEKARPDAAPDESEDDRRRQAAERNRKATEEQWARNKREWVERNFPEKAGKGSPA